MNQSVISYHYAGVGEKTVFCFHGFGESGSSFAHLAQELGESYTIIAVDLPFHGSTEWTSGLTLHPHELFNILDAISNQLQIDPGNRISLLGYSLGGRIAMHLAQLAPQRIEQLLLVAPDGLHMNFWYWLGTQTVPGNRLFAYTMRNPGWFFSLAQFAHKTGLVNKSVMRFIHQYIDDAEARMQLYQRWTTLRKFRPSAAKLHSLAQHHGIPIRFLFGRHDRIILHKRSRVFASATDLVNITIIDAGHNLMREKYTAHIARLFSR